MLPLLVRALTPLTAGGAVALWGQLYALLEDVA